MAVQSHWCLRYDLFKLHYSADTIPREKNVTKGKKNLRSIKAYALDLQFEEIPKYDSFQFFTIHCSNAMGGPVAYVLTDSKNGIRRGPIWGFVRLR